MKYLKLLAVWARFFHFKRSSIINYFLMRVYVHVNLPIVLNKWVGSSAKAPVRHTLVECLSSYDLDAVIPTTVTDRGISPTTLPSSMIHSFVMHDSKLSSVPPHVLFSPPTSSVESEFAIWPAVSLDPLRLWSAMESYTASLHSNSFRGTHMQQWQQMAVEWHLFAWIYYIFSFK